MQGTMKEKRNRWQDWIIMRIIGRGHPSTWEQGYILHAVMRELLGMMMITVTRRLDIVMMGSR